MKKLSTTLLAAMLAGYWGSISAQVTVSSFEKEQETSGADSSAHQQTNTTSLIQQLEAAGWQVTKKQNGNLIVTRKTPGGNEAPSGNNWQHIEQQLQTTGWRTSRDENGTLTLIPPTSAASTPPVQRPGQRIPRNGMLRQLRNAGWAASQDSDGNMLLYPPGNTATNKPAPCPGTAPAIAIQLPVDSWQEAHDIATDWLSHQADYNATVGKIRKILNIYIISIVTAQKPYNLVQQIAIRNHDGAVIVLN